MKVDRKHLLTTLGHLKPGLANKEIIEQSTSFIFTEGKVLTYNDEVAVQAPVEELGFVGAVKAKEFISLLEKLKDDEIDLSVPSGAELLVKMKKSSAGIRLEQDTTAIHDIIRGVGEPAEWWELPATFLPAALFCSFSAGSDMTKPLLTCLCFSGRDVWASDNFRATHYDMGAAAELQFQEPLLIPASIIKDLRGYAPIEFSMTNGWAHFRNDAGVIFSCRVMEGTYPEDVIRKIVLAGDEAKAQRVKLPEGVTEALERAGIFSSSSTLKVANDNRVSISLEEGLLTLRGEGAAGWFEEESRVRYQGAPVEFEVSPDVLQEILTYTHEATIGERVLRFKGENFTHAVAVLAGKGKKK